MEQLGGPITTMPPNELAAKVLFSMDDDTFGVPAEKNVKDQLKGDRTT